MKNFQSYSSAIQPKILIQREMSGIRYQINCGYTFANDYNIYLKTGDENGIISYT